MSISRRHILGMGAALSASLCLPAASWAASTHTVVASARQLLILRAGGASDAGFASGVTTVAGAAHIHTLDLDQLLGTGLRSCASTLGTMRGRRVVGLIDPRRYAMLQEVLRELGAGVWAEGYHPIDDVSAHRFTSLPRSEDAGARLSALLADAKSQRVWPAATGALMAQIALRKYDPRTRDEIAMAMPALIDASQPMNVIGVPQVSFVAEL